MAWLDLLQLARDADWEEYEITGLLQTVRVQTVFVVNEVAQFRNHLQPATAIIASATELVRDRLRREWHALGLDPAEITDSRSLPRVQVGWSVDHPVTDERNRILDEVLTFAASGPLASSVEVHLPGEAFRVAPGTATCAATLDCLASHLASHGRVIGGIVVRGVVSVEDLLRVYPHMAAAGLVTRSVNGEIGEVPVIPALEDAPSLAAGAGILRAWLIDDITRRSVFHHAARRGETSMTQPVALFPAGPIGIGDEAASTAIAGMAEVAGSSGVRSRCLFGGGLTPGDGAARFIEAIPVAALDSDLWLIEPHDVRERWYSDVESATGRLSTLLEQTFASSLRYRLSVE